MATNGSFSVLSSAAATAPTSERFPQHVLASSIASLSSPSSAKQSSHISKTYRQSSTLFLTRRLPEALTTLLPLISPPEPEENGEPVPVARASRTTRIKVWSLYLTILNAIVELEPDEGKDSFGQTEWRALCSKIRDGEIWEEVVRNGYHGVEGDVDADVVINLATILLTHGRDQTLNQKRLEAYLATSAAPNLDLNGRFGQPPSPGSRYRSPAKGASGANTPRDLNARVKLLELYTLHILPRNNDWEYAREFIAMSPVLDEERREAFLQALQSLQDEQHEQERLEQEEHERQEAQLKQELEEAKRLRAENEERERKRLEEERSNREAEEEASELDFGVEDTPSISGSVKGRQTRKIPDAVRSPRLPPANSRTNRKAVAPPTITARASMVLSRLRAIMEQLTISLNSNPMLLMRLLVFMMGFIILLGNKNTRLRVQRALSTFWGKLKATAGMGTRVSYI
ncbi:unnamed protein product [Clonostachys solani]|uniref:Peroxin 26 n=1 Tax=Clonostachys solani TaxID=160281 RepID=A0A9N9Z5D6_9HYPO|nr:unnamed protein product [Clonostachys solani]